MLIFADKFLTIRQMLFPNTEESVTEVYIIFYTCTMVINGTDELEMWFKGPQKRKISP